MKDFFGIDLRLTMKKLELDFGEDWKSVDKKIVSTGIK